MADISFEDKGKIEIPDKGDIREEKMVEQSKKTIEKEAIDQAVREELGAEKGQAARGSFTKDVPQLVFRFCAKAIDCPRFELDDQEAQTFATHLNIVLPIGGKAASFVILIMITLNKVVICLDAIKKKFSPPPLEREPARPDLGEQIS